MAPQLTGTNGLPRRGLAVWMKRANTSLPVPVSPVSSTVASLAAMRAHVRLVSISGDCGPWTSPEAALATIVGSVGLVADMAIRFRLCGRLHANPIGHYFQFFRYPRRQRISAGPAIATKDLKSQPASGDDHFEQPHGGLYPLSAPIRSR